MSVQTTALRQAPDLVPARAGFGGVAAVVALVVIGLLASAYLTLPRGLPHARPAADLDRHPAPLARMPFDALVPDRLDRERRRQRLERFSWVDRQRGLVRIPIEDAMRLVVEESHR